VIRISITCVQIVQPDGTFPSCGRRARPGVHRGGVNLSIRRGHTAIYTRARQSHASAFAGTSSVGRSWRGWSVFIFIPVRAAVRDPERLPSVFEENFGDSFPDEVAESRRRLPITREGTTSTHWLSYPHFKGMYGVEVYLEPARPSPSQHRILVERGAGRVLTNGYRHTGRVRHLPHARTSWRCPIGPHPRGASLPGERPMLSPAGPSAWQDVIATGPSCGRWSWRPAGVLDMSHYTMVKTTFSTASAPAHLPTSKPDTGGLRGLEVLGYEDFRSRLSVTFSQQKAEGRGKTRVFPFDDAFSPGEHVVALRCQLNQQRFAKCHGTLVRKRVRQDLQLDNGGRIFQSKKGNICVHSSLIPSAFNRPAGTGGRPYKRRSAADLLRFMLNILKGESPASIGCSGTPQENNIRPNTRPSHR
jgi:hypothetical protein